MSAKTFRESAAVMAADESLPAADRAMARTIELGARLDRIANGYNVDPIALALKVERWLLNADDPTDARVFDIADAYARRLANGHEIVTDFAVSESTETDTVWEREFQVNGATRVFRSRSKWVPGATAANGFRRSLASNGRGIGPDRPRQWPPSHACQEPETDYVVGEWWDQFTPAERRAVSLVDSCVTAKTKQDERIGGIPDRVSDVAVRRLVTWSLDDRDPEGWTVERVTSEDLVTAIKAIGRVAGIDPTRIAKRIGRERTRARVQRFRDRADARYGKLEREN